MKKKHSIIYDNFLAGINAVLPITILVFFLGWALKLVFALIEPVIIFLEPNSNEQTLLVKVFALFLVMLIVTVIGAVIQDKRYRRRFARLESRLFKILPGYTMVKETMLQVLGTKRAPFSQVAIVNVFENNTRQIAFITQEHQNGSYTVFVPTGPNPTSGNIYHLDKKQVSIVDIPYEQAMKAIIACGIDSKNVFEEK
jgi:uncharacterized membrane protein